MFSNWFNKLSIKNKLITIMVGTTLLVLIISFTTASLFELKHYREDIESNISTISRVVADNIVAPLIFGDQEEGQRVLTMVENNEAINTVVVFDADNKVFVRYVADKNEEIPIVVSLAARKEFTNGQFIIIEPILLDGKLHGVMYLKASTLLNEKFIRFITLMTVIMIFSIIMAFIVATLLQKSISVPISHLAKTAYDIKQNNDYSVRVQTQLKDEVGELYTGFNEMLEQIDFREREFTEAINVLADSEQYNRNLFEKSTISLIVIHTDGRIIDANPAFCKLVNCSGEMIVDKVFFDFFAESEKRQLIASFKEVGSENPTYDDIYSLVNTVGQEIPVRITHSSFYQKSTEYYWVSVENLTELQRSQKQKNELEEQLRQSQKMEAIGKLAGGVAHDFNNLLTAIMGYSDVLLKRTKEQRRVQHDLKEVLKAAERASGLTRQLLAFSRKQVLQPKMCNLNSVITDLNKMLKRLVGETITYETRLNPKLGATMIDIHQMEQVIVNLVVNAKDAMPNGGNLTVETDNIHLDSSYSSIHANVETGDYVMVAITDTGTGMTSEVKSRIFEPFFTTKDAGKGTGLGLSTVYGIIQQSNGYVWVYSEVGKGTTFKIYLPLVEGEVRDTIDESETDEKDLMGKERILVAEDEDIVRNLIIKVLKNHGYKVLEAADGPEALAVSDRFDKPIDLLLTDVSMPSMDGRTLAQRLSEKRTDMKVIFMSGYTDDTVIRNGILTNDTHYIQKPFTPNSLALKIRSVLDEN